MSTTRAICLIAVFVCLLAISDFSYGDCWDWLSQWNPVGSDCNWNNPDNWSCFAQSEPCGDAVIPTGPIGPCITGDAACCHLMMMPWSWVGAPDCEVDVYSGNVNFGYGVEIATWGTFDSNTSGKGILKVLGGTVTVAQFAGAFGMVIGSQFGLTYGRAIMYGGSISVPAVTLYYGDIALYGGTLECTGDSNFVFSQVRPQNKIDISGGTLHIHGDATSTLSALIVNGRIYSSRGILATPFYDGTWTTLISNYNDMVNAWGPSPANLATNVHYRVNDVNVGITLSWQPGDLAKQHDVYFGTSFADVNSATTASALYKGSRYDANGDPCNWTIADFNFKLNTNYYWRIDETNNSNVLAQGLVWNFRTHDGKAYNPRPRDGQVGLNEPLALTWTAGDWASSTDGHRVYVGTDNASVLSATGTNTATKIYRATVTGTSYSLSSLATNWYGPLVPGTTYYWKIAEVNGTTIWGGGLSNGTVWSFTPASYITIEDFEDYNNTADINANWMMGYAATCGGGPPITPSGTLSFVLDADGKHGNFSYDESTATKQFSEVKRYYGSGGTVFSDTSVLALQPVALRVDYIGVATNAVDTVYDRMYVALEDSAGNVGVFDNPDGNAAQVTSWTQWYVSLKDINSAGTPNVVQLAAVSAFYLGFGERCLPNGSQNTGGTGNVMFDNIRLYAQACDPDYAHTHGLTADFNGDCDVDLEDLAILAEYWLQWVTSFPPCTSGPCPLQVDIFPDSFIDFKDFAVLGNEWRTEILWPPLQ
ncbi:MAG: hypothetical protein ABSF37_02705 [Sedimentisphaerales bacterium]|jgi:hypothetical protein